MQLSRKWVELSSPIKRSEGSTVCIFVIQVIYQTTLYGLIPFWVSPFFHTVRHVAVEVRRRDGRSSRGAPVGAGEGGIVEFGVGPALAVGALPLAARL